MAPYKKGQKEAKLPRKTKKPRRKQGLRGNPWKPTAVERASLIRAAELGYTYEQMAKLCHVSIEILRAARGRDPILEDDIDIARDRFKLDIQSALYDLVTDREKSVVIHLSKTKLKNTENQQFTPDDIVRMAREILADLDGAENEAADEKK